MADINVSVIVPVYGVRQYLGKCLASIFAQSLKGFEVIIVDDASTDGSLDVAKECVACLNRDDIHVRIIRHDLNKGLPSARNTGLDAAKGKYIFHFDGDDFADHSMLEALHDEAEDKGADIVWCDWFLTSSRGERYMRQPGYSTSTEAINGMLGGAMKFNVWNKLVRRSLYDTNNIRFPERRAMGEDLTMIKLFAHADKVSYLPRAFYHYVKYNSGAYSRNYNAEHLSQLRENVCDLSAYLQERAPGQFDIELNLLKLEVKFPFLLMAHDRKRFYGLWKEWYPEANRFISANRYISLRSRMIQQLACMGLFPLVTLYSKALNAVNALQ